MSIVKANIIYGANFTGFIDTRLLIVLCCFTSNGQI